MRLARALVSGADITAPCVRLPHQLLHCVQDDIVGDILMDSEVKSVVVSQ